MRHLRIHEVASTHFGPGVRLGPVSQSPHQTGRHGPVFKLAFRHIDAGQKGFDVLQEGQSSTPAASIISAASRRKASKRSTPNSSAFRMMVTRRENGMCPLATHDDTVDWLEAPAAFASRV